MMVGDKAALYTQERKSGVDVTEIAGPWAECRSKDTNTWLLVAYDPSVKDKVVVKAHGDGGLAEMRQHLTDDIIAFGAFPFNSSGQRKFGFLSWVGPSVSALKKGKVSLQKAGVYNAFEGVVADIQAMNKDDLEDAAILGQLRKTIKSGDVSL